MSIQTIDLVECRRGEGLPEGLEETLRAKPLAEQMAHFAISKSAVFERSSYGETDSSRASNSLTPLSKYRELSKLIVEDGVIVGVVIEDVDFNGNVFPFERVCTYSACDENGSGSKTREDYAQLVCVQEAHPEWIPEGELPETIELKDAVLYRSYRHGQRAYILPDGAEEKLRALPIEEQVGLYTLRCGPERSKLSEAADRILPIVHDGMVVGVRVTIEDGETLDLFAGFSWPVYENGSEWPTYHEVIFG